MEINELSYANLKNYLIKELKYPPYKLKNKSKHFLIGELLKKRISVRQIIDFNNYLQTIDYQ